ncbi:dTDP-4-dehydrorhamnose reductase [Corynebacterium sp.]|uniref:dTDP-4-dehydrorhamnose reductase n=1 Tax=Corynebacterium sp. TaxID=1720 RepID=UPI0026DD7084|nr:dTDP-4-dehydrorhamnose reductase [Corynebacterium sp.]MDO5077229.1 dTDP-4-dehydrorhamnose reductase [Corynebacterium sp.]
MRVAVTGGDGQVAAALRLTQPPHAQAHYLTRGQLDITDRRAVAEHPALEVDVIINAAAYTAVDAAESDAATAMAINGHAPSYLAQRGPYLVQLSTDYVFGGNRRRPLRIDDATAPSTVYGATKLAGERAAMEVSNNLSVVRTAWVYSGNTLPNHGCFVSTMLRLAAGDGEVRVVDDQVGSPTYALDLARGLWEVAQFRPRGVLHAVGAGQASWWDLARETFRAAGADPERVIACSSQDFPRPAARPTWSVLDSSSWEAAGLRPLPAWQTGVARATTARI